MKKGYVSHIEKETLQNTDYRRVLYTGEHSQLVLMSIELGDEIGNEVHHLDQFIRIEAGEGKAILNNTDEYSLEDGSAVLVPAGVWHNIVNTGNVPLKLYSVYSPPEHKDGTVHRKKSDEVEERFDGTTSE